MAAEIPRNRFIPYEPEGADKRRVIGKRTLTASLSGPVADPLTPPMYCLHWLGCQSPESYASSDVQSVLLLPAQSVEHGIQPERPRFNTDGDLASLPFPRWSTDPPPYTNHYLIWKAITAAQGQKLTFREITDALEKRFKYYRFSTSSAKWKVRTLFTARINPLIWTSPE